jgi:TPP-dependent pyruvate/acetoin dehydrogenase alpha subunit
LERGITDKGSIEELQRRIHSEIDEAIRVAENDPFPDPEDCLKDVYEER